MENPSPVPTKYIRQKTTSFTVYRPETEEQVQIIEERISKVNGDYTVRRYNKGKMLGKGGFAKCYEVQNLESKKVLAAKIIVKSSLTKTRSRQKVIRFLNNMVWLTFYFS